MPWFYGNLHCHSRRSDGDSPARTVARFYRDLGYAFVAITDHDRCTGPLHCGNPGPGFTVLGACEYSAHAEGRPLHINGIGATAAPAKPVDAGVLATMQAGVDGFRAQGAFTILNHPNWCWGFGLADMLAVRGAHAFEIWNGAPDSNNLGDAEHPGTEALWDAALSRGARLWAVASDDCHHFGKKRQFRSDPPCSGWVAVQAPRNDADSVIRALKAGRFYASNGPRLRRYAASRRQIAIELEPWGLVAQRIVFIGREGRELASERGLRATYQPRGDEGYIRVRVETGQGDRAWTQPVFLA